MIRVAIVEDEDKEAALLEEYLQRYGKKYGETFSSVRYTNAVDFLTGYRSEYDIVFMDIELRLMDGMDACFKLREMDQKINIIFVNNMAQYAVKGYEVQAFYYIVKPISYYNLESCLGRAIKQIGLNGDDEIRLSLQKGVVRIRVSRLYYVEVAGHHLIWHTQDGNFENSGTLKAAESKLPAGFSRCNNCYLVNLRHVTGIDGYEVKVGEDTLAVSHARRKPFLHDLNEYLGG